MKTIKEAKAILKPLGISFTRLSETNEYRVNLRNGTEATAYYGTDIEDSVNTGIAMARRRDETEARLRSNKEKFNKMMEG